MFTKVPAPSRRTRAGQVAVGLLVIIVVVCAVGGTGMGMLGHVWAEGVAGQGTTTGPGALGNAGAALAVAVEAGIEERGPVLGIHAGETQRRFPGLRAWAAERQKRRNAALLKLRAANPPPTFAARPDIYARAADRALLMFPPTAWLRDPAEAKAFWRGLRDGAIQWVKDVGGSFIALLNPKNHPPKNDYPVPLNYLASIGGFLKHIVTKPGEVMAFVAHAVGGMAENLVGLGQGCLLRPGSAYDVGHKCGQVGAEVASYFAGSELAHGFFNTKWAPQFLHLGGKAHGAERVAVSASEDLAERLTAALAGERTSTARWVGNRALGLFPHFFDDGPRVLVRGVRREEMNEAGAVIPAATEEAEVTQPGIVQP